MLTFQLVLHQIIISSLLLYQRSMVARLHYLTAIQYHNLVGILYRTQAVGNHYYRPALIECIQILNDGTLVLGIQGIGSFVQKDERRLLIYSPRYQDALLLTLAQPYPVTPYQRVVFQRKAHDIDGYWRCVRLVPSGPRPLPLVYRNIPRDGFRKNHPVLRLLQFQRFHLSIYPI